jgi:hypothetical protein
MSQHPIRVFDVSKLWKPGFFGGKLLNEGIGVCTVALSFFFLDDKTTLRVHVSCTDRIPVRKAATIDCAPVMFSNAYIHIYN